MDFSTVPQHRILLPYSIELRPRLRNYRFCQKNIHPLCTSYKLCNSPRISRLFPLFPSVFSSFCFPNSHNCSVIALWHSCAPTELLRNRCALFKGGNDLCPHGRKVRPLPDRRVPKGTSPLSPCAARRVLLLHTSAHSGSDPVAAKRKQAPLLQATPVFDYRLQKEYSGRFVYDFILSHSFERKRSLVLTVESFPLRIALLDVDRTRCSEIARLSPRRSPPAADIFHIAKHCFNRLGRIK